MHSFQPLEIILLWIFDFSIPAVLQAPAQMSLGQCIFSHICRIDCPTNENLPPVVPASFLVLKKYHLYAIRKYLLQKWMLSLQCMQGIHSACRQELALVVLGGSFQPRKFNDSVSGFLALSCVRAPFPLQQSPAQVTDFPREKAGKKLALTQYSCALSSRILNTAS